MAFTDVQGDGFVPACTLGVGQKAKLVFGKKMVNTSCLIKLSLLSFYDNLKWHYYKMWLGHDVNALKFFTLCGLQEGYEPFCVLVQHNDNKY